MEAMTSDLTQQSYALEPAKATEATTDVERFMGGYKPAEWASGLVTGASSIGEEGAYAIQELVTEYRNNLKSQTQDVAGAALGAKVWDNYNAAFLKVFGPYTKEQAVELFKNKPMQVLQGLLAGIPYSSPTMPMSIAQALKNYSYIVPGASVGKGGGLFRTIKLPKGVTNRPTRYRAPNPVMILMQITNFIWHLVGLPGMAPYFVSQAAMAYYRSLIGFNPTTSTMTKANIASILDALETNHPAMMQLFYDSQVYSQATRIAKEKSKTTLSAARQAFRDQLDNINSFAKGQELFGKLLSTSNSINVTATTDAATVKTSMLSNYANPIAKPVKLPRGVGYYKVGTGDDLGPVKTVMGTKYKYNKGQWADLPSSYDETVTNAAIEAIKNKGTLAQQLENAKAEQEVKAAQDFLTKKGYKMAPANAGLGVQLSQVAAQIAAQAPPA